MRLIWALFNSIRESGFLNFFWECKWYQIDRPCHMNLSPNPSFQQEEPCILCQMPPRDPSLPISTQHLFLPSLRESREELLFCLSLAQSGFQGRGSWEEGECLCFESRHFMRIVVTHPMGRKDTCTHMRSDMPRVSHFRSYTPPFSLWTTSCSP